MIRFFRRIDDLMIRFFRRIDKFVAGAGEETPISLILTIAVVAGIVLGVLIYGVF